MCLSLSRPDLPPDLPSDLPPVSCCPDLAALAESLQQTARTLLAFAQSGSDHGDAMRDEPAAAAKEPSQLRTYRLAGYIVKEEKKLLAAYRAEDWQELFSMVCDKFEIIYSLMRHFHEDEVITGFFLHQIAKDLMAQPLRMLSQLSSLVADFRAEEQEGI